MDGDLRQDQAQQGRIQASSSLRSLPSTAALVEASPGAEAMEAAAKSAARSEDSGQLLHIAQMALDGARAHAHLIEARSGVDGLARGLHHLAELGELGLDLAQHAQTSEERFSIASVLKPICRLLSMAARLAGPVTITAVVLQALDQARAAQHFGKQASVGRYITAKSVVCGGARYLAAIFLASAIEVSNALPAAMIASAASCASCRRW
jgi:hypothetical protein